MSSTEGGPRLYGGIEAGGTKFICAVGNATGEILEQTRIDTRDPVSTLAEVQRYFEAARERCGDIAALGVGAFGPLDLRPTSPTYGFITSTPKPGWANTDLAGILNRGLKVAVRLDTDVNGAAFGELRWGAGRNLSSVAYVTVGTGIGVGAVHHGRAVHGLMHMEMGHVMVRRHAVILRLPARALFMATVSRGWPPTRPSWRERAPSLALRRPRSPSGHSRRTTWDSCVPYSC